MTDPYDFNTHLNCDAPRPAGVVTARIKTTHAAAIHPHRRKLLHRPVYAVTAIVKGKYVLGARFACGAASKNVTGVTDPTTTGLPLCKRCEQAISDAAWAVYAYYDARGRTLYVGQTSDVAGRRKGHARASSWHSQQAWFAVLSTHTTLDEALKAEAAAITSLNPIYNVVRPRTLPTVGAA